MFAGIEWNGLSKTGSTTLHTDNSCTLLLSEHSCYLSTAVIWAQLLSEHSWYLQTDNICNTVNICTHIKICTQLHHKSQSQTVIFAFYVFVIRESTPPAHQTFPHPTTGRPNPNPPKKPLTDSLFSPVILILKSKYRRARPYCEVPNGNSSEWYWLVAFGHARSAKQQSSGCRGSCNKRNKELLHT